MTDVNYAIFEACTNTKNTLINVIKRERKSIDKETCRTGIGVEKKQNLKKEAFIVRYY